MDSDIFVALAKTGYAFDVVSDLAMATISTLLLWSPEMAVKSKIMTGVALGFGIITGKIVMWTVIECSLGIIAGSIPMLKFTRKRKVHEDKMEEFEMNKSDADFRRAVTEAAGTAHQDRGAPRSS
ncbi:hypothetical protein M406DRAFT_70126 [Cryphonectria parasitica EP155]|uniref:Uncharacterized protein n=1 Tax=Cryphonectria parasitica (strain ATCC 38755 / EP155) TaxID=660469 RepID=A0A9P4Y6U7_CRYP1|nr:uncharacterized protein M406DRAFT_70126 [Cryphonectria parasitica EP155]KAF3768024.1 hypothetical protein M406DRAFT_70126 [Cryphonectria parasitica EP155]